MTAMHTDLHDQLHYKDVRGAWRLAVTFGAETVTVRHIKSEMTIAEEEAAYFRFEWALSLTLSR